MFKWWLRKINWFNKTYVYGTSKDLTCTKEKIQHNSTIKQYKNV